MKKHHGFELPPAQIKVFEVQDFENQAPGTVLRDFGILLSLIGDQGMQATPAHLFGMNVLETINRNLTHPLKLRLKRPKQKFYPNIHGLYLLLRATGIGLIDTRGKKPLIKLDPVVLASWHALNGTERYFALLKAWWARASEEMLGERRGFRTDVLSKNIEFIKYFPKDGTLTIDKPHDADMLRYTPGLYNLALLESFGLVDVLRIFSTESTVWLPERIRMTDWGKTVLGSYVDFISKSLDRNVESVLPLLGFTGLIEPIECFDRWSRVVRPYCKGWQKDLDIPLPLFKPGRYVFKVSLGPDCWRRIAIRGGASLDEFAATILSAFDFDRDHLYQFSYKDRFGCTVDIDHPYMEGDTINAFTDDVKVGDLPLSEGTRIGFLFDFGDEWNFGIETESLNVGAKNAKTQVLETHGTAPEQYRDW